MNPTDIINCYGVYISLVGKMVLKRLWSVSEQVLCLAISSFIPRAGTCDSYKTTYSKYQSIVLAIEVSSC